MSEYHKNVKRKALPRNTTSLKPNGIRDKFETLPFPVQISV